MPRNYNHETAVAGVSTPGLGLAGDTLEKNRVQSPMTHVVEAAAGTPSTTEPSYVRDSMALSVMEKISRVARCSRLSVVAT